MPLRSLTALILAALAAALLQGMPILWPGPGRLLAALAHLPMACVAVLFPRWAPLSGTLAVAMLVTLDPREAAVFTLTTGPFGLVLGSTFARGWAREYSLAATTATLTLGMAALAFLLGMPVPGLPIDTLTPWQQVGLYLAGAAGWSALWLLPVELCCQWAQRQSRSG